MNGNMLYVMTLCSEFVNALFCIALYMFELTRPTELCECWILNGPDTCEDFMLLFMWQEAWVEFLFNWLNIDDIGDAQGDNLKMKKLGKEGRS
ncbi:unnamed protein product [Vicia faba]|uniref:Uncharacterized protein n=1 Tax=Vicia faba TaxID=3906 RepID=A0AAV1AIQ3_VICFA|nr:unnamed protein product [Vicia faba]